MHGCGTRSRGSRSTLIGSRSRRGDEVVHVEPQVFDVLVYLVEHRDTVVTKTELLDACGATAS